MAELYLEKARKFIDSIGPHATMTRDLAGMEGWAKEFKILKNDLNLK